MCVCVHAKSLQLCLTLCNPMDSSPPDSSVHGDSPGNKTGVGCCALLQYVCVHTHTHTQTHTHTRICVILDTTFKPIN